MADITLLQRFNEKERWGLFCPECDSRSFKLMSDGPGQEMRVVECSNCGSVIEDVKVVME